ncbi:MAG: 16S rRNA (guanine(527)-N(7))-methyltransferase RsmG, partial [Ignavibacteriae bacterium]|nr:16S rRNA (guanine(527)-N(7))-methyltransferase RsmG [Ignavibacteriota bacterium]
FNKFNKYLLDWNSKINLISRNSKSIEIQVLNSIFFLTKYSIPENSRIVDIGTGGGFPGIPLKILKDDLRLTLIDSIIKKTYAVKDIIENLKLKNIEIKCGRAETISRELKYKKGYNIVTAKSVATLDKLYGWTKSFLKEKGVMIFIKGGDITEELNSLKKKNKNISVEVIIFEFDKVYKIEDKKIVIIKKF